MNNMVPGIIHVLLKQIAHKLSSILVLTSLDSHVSRLDDDPIADYCEDVGRLSSDLVLPALEEAAAIHIAIV
jgi:hypothetical protein